MKKHILFLLLAFHIIVVDTHAYNLRQISSRDGLSNSSVTCLFQDNERFLWIGTYDGLNMYNSRDISIYKPDINNLNSLSSNIIRKIVETGGDYLWISTKWGLNKLSKQTNTIEEYYKEFGECPHVVKDSNDNLFVLVKSGFLSIYSKEQRKFMDVATHEGMIQDNVRNLIIDAKDMIWILHKGKLEKYQISFSNPDAPKAIRYSDFNHPYSIVHTFYSNKEFIIIDEKGDLYRIDGNENKYFIRNLHQSIQESGDISSIIFNNQDILIGFRTNGLICLNASKGYKIEKIDINCGVFSLWKDYQQDIVWIGTDGQGVYAWTKDEYIFHNISLNQLPVKKQRPIRAIYTDAWNTLWLGTKDNGIIRIQNYDTNNEFSTANVNHLTTQDGLENNAVFAFAPNTSRSILWIGSEGPGLNYYSYKDQKIHSLVNETNCVIDKVHSILEMGDSLLWVGSGNILHRVTLQYIGNKIAAKVIRPISLDIPNRQLYTQIYSIHAESDSIIWIGMRGNGAVRLNVQTEAYQLINFNEKGIAPMNDILCIYQDKKKNIWLGCSYGLTKVSRNPNGSFEYKNFNENQGLPNNTIHGITEDTLGNLWLSSNTGIILFYPETTSFRSYNNNTGLKVIEFSDNAYFQDNTHHRYFYGGVDGIVWIENDEKKEKTFVPDIYFTQLRIYNKEYNISEFKKSVDGKTTIELTYDQSSFAISFVAMDFINGENSTYSYLLENFSDVWMDTHTNEAQFTNIAPGHYILRVKYHDGINNDESMTQCIHISILPPWYLTITAKIVYILLTIASLVGFFIYFRRKFEHRKASIARKLNEKYKEEIYEGKLRFFTNITHEFCTPLTLIHGPCQRILEHSGSDAFIKKYAQIIQSNTERLNSLIQEVIDFRRMETGNKICHIEELNISKLALDIIDSFDELADQNHIHLQKLIEPDISWNSDKSCFSKILTNLISNAFKYTPERGSILITVKTDNTNLRVTVYNTGKGISKENIPVIFNRYSVLDNIKENSIKGLSSRNGLGLAICHSMTKMLQGEIEVESEINQYAQFTVTLPLLEKTVIKESDVVPSSEIQQLSNVLRITTSILENSRERSTLPKANILAIDDNKELLWMLKDILSDEYNVFTAENGVEGLALLKQQTPDLIITDVMMPEIDGITLTKQLKGNKHTAHIPLVILSARNTTDEKIEGIESGADAYISKPFDTLYLKTVIRQLIQKHKELEHYFNSSASAFDFSGGQLLQKEDKEFLEAAVKAINENIDNAAFTPDELAMATNTSSRNLYRKFKNLNQLSPKDFIKEQRVNFAARLLVTTTLTIQEIMYRTAFVNRSHFYKEFAKRYNQTPKEYRDTHKQKDNSFM